MHMFFGVSYGLEAIYFAHMFDDCFAGDGGIRTIFSNAFWHIETETK